jgi:hypothetical protein
MTEATALNDTALTDTVTENTAPALGLSADEARALYYSNRLAYDSRDNRRAIGRYTATGAVDLFSKHHSAPVGEATAAQGE